MSERFKEPVLKTGDPSDGTVGSNPTLSANFLNTIIFGLRKYPRGRRGSPAKGVGRETGARVQIPPSAPSCSVLYAKTLFFFLRGDANPVILPSQKVLTKNGFTFETIRSVEEDHSTVDVYSIQI